MKLNEATLFFLFTAVAYFFVALLMFDDGFILTGALSLLGALLSAWVIKMGSDE